MGSGARHENRFGLPGYVFETIGIGEIFLPLCPYVCFYIFKQMYMVQPGGYVSTICIAESLSNTILCGNRIQFILSYFWNERTQIYIDMDRDVIHLLW